MNHVPGHELDEPSTCRALQQSMSSCYTMQKKPSRQTVLSSTQRNGYAFAC